MAYELINNKEKNQYEFHIEGYIARVVYKEVDGIVELKSTVVPPSISEKGIGARLLKAVLEDLKSKDLKFRPYCSFITRYISLFPEWKAYQVK